MDESNSFANNTTTQWVVSLAVSVICCAILFVVFGGNQMEQNAKSDALIAKVDLLQSRIDRLSTQIEMMQKPVVAGQPAGVPVPQVFPPLPGSAPTATPEQAPAAVGVVPTTVTPSGPAAPVGQ